MDDIDFVVVGAGVAGSATARRLAQTGHDVALFEQFELGHKRGSSHGTSRIFRLSYDDPDFVRMAQEALVLWRDLEREAGEKLLVTTGGLDIGADIGGHIRALNECDVAYEVLDGPEVTARWPNLGFGGDTGILFQRDAGVVFADRVLASMVASATAAGCEVKPETKVESIHIEGGHAILETTAGTVRASVVVVTAGAWAKSLLAPIGIDLPVVATRETVVYFRMEDEYSVPALVEWTDPPQYALASPGVGVKASEHHAGPTADPDEPGEVDGGLVERIGEWVARRYPNADPHPAGAETCLYTNTDDERFVMERHGPVVVGSACSGHAFKFGPVTGRRLADLATRARM
jgi:sarcosine oxidase